MLARLESNELILLMFLAGELPAEDRTEVAQMLATDAGLRRQLEILRSANEAFSTGLMLLDAASPLKASEGAVVRRVGRLLRQRMADKAAAALPAEAPKKSLSYPWWVYPATAAAAVIVASLSWWGNHTDIPAATTMPRWVQNYPGADTTVIDPTENKVMTGLADSLSPAGDQRLDDARDQITSLAKNTDDGSFDFLSRTNE